MAFIITTAVVIAEFDTWYGVYGCSSNKDIKRNVESGRWSIKGDRLVDNGNGKTVVTLKMLPATGGVRVTPKLPKTLY